MLFYQFPFKGAADPVQRGDGSAEPAVRVAADEAEGGADQGQTSFF